MCDKVQIIESNLKAYKKVFLIVKINTYSGISNLITY